MKHSLIAPWKAKMLLGRGKITERGLFAIVSARSYAVSPSARGSHSKASTKDLDLQNKMVRARRSAVQCIVVVIRAIYRLSLLHPGQ